MAEIGVDVALVSSGFSVLFAAIVGVEPFSLLLVGKQEINIKEDNYQT